MINIKRIILTVSSLVMCAALALTLTGCSETKEESLELSTTLEANTSFSGSRTFKAVFPSSFAAEDKSSALSSLIEKYCPRELTYTVDTSAETPTYTFVLAFSSYPDYVAKLTSVLGTRPVVVFSNPSTVLTTGWRIEEYFTSSALLDWLRIAARAEQKEGFELPAAESNTEVVFAGQSVSTLPDISVNRLKGYPISLIQLNTVNKKELFDRTISFVIPMTTFDALRDDLTKYFADATDGSGESGWELDGDNYIYTVRYNDITEKELEGFTNRLLCSVYGDVSYIDKAEGSTPLAYQNSYTETLDFSAYLGEDNSDVPIRYSYSLSDETEISDPLIYSDFEWMTASDILETTTDSGSDVTFKGGAPSLTLRINDGRQYHPASIDLSVTPLDGDTIRKDYTFRYDLEESGKKAADYAQSYFKEMGINAERTTDDGDALCTISFTGTAAELNSRVTDIFGDQNLIVASSGTPFMKLRTQKTVADTVDLSSLLVGKNSDVPVNYTLLPRVGELAESMKTEIHPSASDTQRETTYVEADENGAFRATMPAYGGTITTVTSSANWQDIILFIVVSAVGVLVTIGFIILLVGRQSPAPVLPETEENPKLQSKKKSSSLAKREKPEKKKDEE